MCIGLELSIIVSIETSTIKTIFWFRSAVISRLNKLSYRVRLLCFSVLE